MAELVGTYLDLPLGIVDAAVVAIAERLQLTEIATLDHRHFAVVRCARLRIPGLITLRELGAPTCTIRSIRPGFWSHCFGR
jgi:hypothetical protein